MKRTNIMKNSIFAVISLAVGALLVLPGSAQDAWEKATADKLDRFLPGLVSGLSQQFPWDAKDFNKPEPLSSGYWFGSEITIEQPDYAPAGVIQHWRIADAKLLEEVKKAEKEAAAAQAAMMRGEAPVKEDPGMERKLQELENKMQKASEAGDTAEILRLQKEYQRISAPASEQSKKTGEIADRPGQLKKTVRELRVVITANLAPSGAEIWSAEVKSKSGNKANPVPPAATIQGYPVGRNPRSLNGGVSYTIRLGPPGINTGPGTGPHMRKEVKALFVMVEVQSDSEHQTADEALALKTLEKVDYAGLLKLLVP